MPFYAGNIHCHSTNSDGDSSPAVVAQAYQDAGFDFVSITDHNTLTDPKECAVDNPNFLVIPGSEYSGGINEPRFRSIHVNGIGIQTPFEVLESFSDISSGLQHAVDQTHAQQAFSVLNHPNWRWSFGAEEIKAVKHADAFEVWNGGWTCNSAGDTEHPSTDEIWDSVLSSGKNIFGVGSDDCHHFADNKRHDPFVDKIASAWIEVQASKLEQSEIIAALKRGDFIATSRIKLDSLERSKTSLSFTIKEWEDVCFTTHIIGKNGEVLDQQQGRSIHYAYTGDELYVRAKVFASTGDMLWTQPVFLG